MHRSRRGRLNVVLWLVALLVAAPVHAAEDAASHARRGADLFKQEQYFDAAVEFEQAARLDPGDPRNLRYAGRAWQEVGHLRRALVLLEAYLRIETDPVLRASVEEKLAPLRRATPRQVVDGLSAALVRYPQARLEADAAQAWEALDTAEDVQRASALWEVARVRAGTDAERQAAEEGLQRTHARLLRLRDRQEPAPAASAPPVAAPAPVQATTTARTTTEPPRLRRGLQIAGGALLAGGGALVWLGYSAADDADGHARGGSYGTNYADYSADRDAADRLALVGWGLAVTGVGLGAASLLVEPPAAGSVAEPAPAVAWRVAPVWSATGGGLAVAGRF